MQARNAQGGSVLKRFVWQHLQRHFKTLVDVPECFKVRLAVMGWGVPECFNSPLPSTRIKTLVDTPSHRRQKDFKTLVDVPECFKVPRNMFSKRFL